MLFPVKTPSGAHHDIDELSSGEKEVLYGYLRIRNAAPRNSVLLIDEPELHLNPRLISGLASFYHRHLGQALGSQLWLVTHSDTLIREAVGQEGFAVFHMQPPGPCATGNQVALVKVNEDLDRVVIDLVGDLAAYRPGAKLVLFEGGGDADFDVRMTTSLFPEFQAAVNAISGGNKRRVSELYDILERVRRAGHLSVKVYAVTDSDGEPRPESAARTQLQWDAYHIENYLLEPTYIHKVLADLNTLPEELDSNDVIFAALRTCAEATIPQLVAHKLRLLANKEFLKCMNFGFSPTTPDAASGISEAIRRSQERINATVADGLSPDQIQRESRRITTEARAQLANGDWTKAFRGRDILGRFLGAHVQGVPYEMFRDLIVARMRDGEYRPPGMTVVVRRILDDSWS